mgnify:CR=1
MSLNARKKLRAKKAHREAFSRLYNMQAHFGSDGSIRTFYVSSQRIIDQVRAAFHVPAHQLRLAPESRF